MRNQSAAGILSLFFVLFSLSIISSSTMTLAAEQTSSSPASCDCGHGVVLSSAPTCTCQCNAGFYPPRCIFRKGEKVAVQMVVNKTEEHFAGGGDFERKVRVGMGLSYLDSDIVFRVREHNTTTFAIDHPGPFSYCQLAIAAELVQPFLDTVDNKSMPFVEEERILLAQPVPLIMENAHSLVDTEIATFQGVRISVNTIGWLIGCVGCIFMLILIDAPCFQNTTSVIEKKREVAAAKNQQQHHHAVVAVEAHEPLFSVVVQDEVHKCPHDDDNNTPYGVVECMDDEGTFFDHHPNYNNASSINTPESKASMPTTPTAGASNNNNNVCSSSSSSTGSPASPLGLGPKHQDDADDDDAFEASLPVLVTDASDDDTPYFSTNINIDVFALLSHQKEDEE